MVDNPTVERHLLQAALWYIEKKSFRDLSGLLEECPGLAQLRGTGDGLGLIHSAAQTGSVAAISLLLDLGADPNMPSGNGTVEEDGSVYYEPGDRALHCAVEAGHADATFLLLAKGADPNVKNCWDIRPLHLARKPHISEALLKAGADPNATGNIRYFNEETLGWHYVGTPLHLAAVSSEIATIRLLIEHGSDVNVWSDGITKRTPLHYAAAVGESEAVTELLKLGADANAIAELSDYSVSRYQMTPLHYAARNGHKEVVLLLLEGGARTSMRGGERHQTTREIAKRAGHEEIVPLLTKKPTGGQTSLL